MSYVSEECFDMVQGNLEMYMQKSNFISFFVA